MRWFLPLNGGVAEVAHHQLSWRGSIRPSSRHQECAAETSQPTQKQRKKKDMTHTHTQKKKKKKKSTILPPLTMVCLNANRVINESTQRLFFTNKNC